jgi:hypothetical protein
MEGARMTKEDRLEYVADMAAQLADLIREDSKATAAALELAAELARDKLSPTR